MTTNVKAKQIFSIIRILKNYSRVFFTGNSDVFFIDCELKSVPKYEFRWSEEYSKYSVYEHRQRQAGEDRIRINFMSFDVDKLFDAVDFVNMYKFMYRNRPNRK